jgi:hypothetical protein
VRLPTRFPSSQKISDSILEKKWPINDSDAKDYAYETPIFVYSKEMD